MNHREVIKSQVSALNQRQELYGTEATCFARIASFASLLLGREVSEYEVAIFNMATKLGRIPERPDYADNYIDLNNYSAFAAQFAKIPDAVQQMENDVRAMASKLSPYPREQADA